MKPSPAIGILALFLAGCGVDPRWGERRTTNPTMPGSPGVDTRWGAPRTGLLDPLKWQYQSLQGHPDDAGVGDTK